MFQIKPIIYNKHMEILQLPTFNQIEVRYYFCPINQIEVISCQKKKIDRNNIFLAFDFP